MPAFPPLARSAVFALIPVLALAGAGLDRAHAQGKLSVVYTISAARIPVGKITWSADIGADSFTTTGSGEAAGLASLAVSGKGTATARGIVKDGRLYTTRFTSDITRDDEKSELTMMLDHGAVTELKSAAPLPGDDRVPVTAAHRQNIVDPLTAWLIPAGAGGGLARAACERTLPIFDGLRRFDLKLAFRRMDKVKADKGYQGPAIVCAMIFQPIAGHRASSTLVKFLSDGRDIEVWLAPVTGTGFLAPFRIVGRQHAGKSGRAGQRISGAGADGARNSRRQRPQRLRHCGRPGPPRAAYCHLTTARSSFSLTVYLQARAAVFIGYLRLPAAAGGAKADAAADAGKKDNRLGETRELHVGGLRARFHCATL